MMGLTEGVCLPAVGRCDDLLDGPAALSAAVPPGRTGPLQSPERSSGQRLKVKDLPRKLNSQTQTHSKYSQYLNTMEEVLTHVLLTGSQLPVISDSVYKYTSFLHNQWFGLSQKPPAEALKTTSSWKPEQLHKHQHLRSEHGQELGRNKVFGLF